MLFLAACSDIEQQSGPSDLLKSESMMKKDDVGRSEYIIVLGENVSITHALDSLSRYEAELIKDLKKGRYVIELRTDPGIERLKKDVEKSEYINFIQPNYQYKAQ